MFRLRIYCAAIGYFLLFATASAKDKEVIYYCVDPSWPPYEFIDHGKHSGIAKDYLDHLAAHTPYQFQLIETSSWSQTLEWLKTGKCEASTFLNKTPQRSQYLVFSDVFFRSANVLVGKGKQHFISDFSAIENQTLSIPKGYRVHEHVEARYPHIKLYLVTNEKQGLEAILNDEADLFSGTLYTMNALLQNKRYHQLAITGWSGLQEEIRFGVSKQKAYILPAINQAFANISERQHAAIARRWEDSRIIDTSDDGLFWHIVACGLLAIVVLTSLVVWQLRFNQRLKRKNEFLSELKQQLFTANAELDYQCNHDSLTQLYNRSYMQQTFDKDCRKSSSDSATSLIILDIDKFKNINDVHGHAAGDKVLKEVSNVFSHCLRSNDVTARWGGEEFVILCKHTEIEDAKHLCERIACCLSKWDFGFPIKVTCSFGIAQLDQDEQIMDCLARADKNLYKAKNSGRNKICT